MKTRPNCLLITPTFALRVCCITFSLIASQTVKMLQFIRDVRRVINNVEICDFVYHSELLEITYRTRYSLETLEFTVNVNIQSRRAPYRRGLVIHENCIPMMERAFKDCVRQLAPFILNDSYRFDLDEVANALYHLSMIKLLFAKVKFDHTVRLAQRRMNQ